MGQYLGVVLRDKLPARRGDHEPVLEARCHQPVEQIVKVDRERHPVGEVGLPDDTWDGARPPALEQRSCVCRELEALAGQRPVEGVAQYLGDVGGQLDQSTGRHDKGLVHVGLVGNESGGWEIHA